MLAFRVEKENYFKSILDGMPGEMFDFRWNSKGNPIIYASESRSLALHEKCANISKPFHGLPKSFLLAAIELPNKKYARIDPNTLPNGWDRIGAYHPFTQEIGNKFIQSKRLAIFVPSTIIKGEFNILINPAQAKKLKLKVKKENINERFVRN